MPRAGHPLGLGQVTSTRRSAGVLSDVELVGDARHALDRRDDAGAIRLLDTVGSGAGDHGTIGLEAELLAVARRATDRPPVGAAAWAASARARRRRGDPHGALEAYEHAIELDPGPELLATWAAVATGVLGTDSITARLEAALQRWPGAGLIRVRLAEQALDRGDTVGARELLDEVKPSDPGGADALACRARLELQAGRVEEAERHARALLPDRPTRGRALLAVTLSSTGRLDEDPGLLAAVLAAPPQDLWTLVRVAEVAAGAGEAAAARSLLDRAVELGPEHPEARISRGLLALRQEDVDLAAADLDHAARYHDDPMLTAVRGEVARVRGDTDTAVTLLESVDEAVRPTWADVALGRARVARGDLVGARAAFENAAQRGPDDVEALCWLADLQLALDGNEGRGSARSLLEHARSITPDDATVLARIGEVHRRAGDLQEAVAAFDEALAVRPDDAYALGSKGQALWSLGSPAASEVLERAVLVAPATAWILDAFVATFEDAEPEGADAELRRVKRAIRNQGGDAGPLQLRRARLALRQRRYAEADRLFRRVRASNPDDRTVASEHARVLQLRGRRAAALAVIDGLPPVTGQDDLDLTWQRIELRWQMDRLDEARAELEELNALPGPDPTAIAALGALRRAEGRREEARALLEEALRREPGYAYPLASLGALEWDEGHVERAREALGAAVAHDGRYGWALTRLATLELDRGDADAVRRLLHQVADDPTDGELVTFRSTCLYGLGEYRAAARVAEEFLEAVGDDTRALRSRAYAELAMGRPRSAASSFAAALVIDDGAAGLIEDVLMLLRLERWSPTMDLLRAQGTGRSGMVLATAAVAHAAGYSAVAAAQAGPLAEAAPHDMWSALLAARTLRMSGAAEPALGHALRLHELSPNDVTASLELAECAFAAGEAGRAHDLWTEVLARLERRVHCDPDEWATRGWCLLRLGRAGEASTVLLRALDVTDRPAVIFFDLTLAGLVHGDVREARVLLGRARDELDALSAPGRRGALTGAIHDLGSVLEVLTPSARRFADDTYEELSAQRAGLDATVGDELALVDLGTPEAALAPAAPPRQKVASR